MADIKVKQLLHPDAVVYIFRHGHAAPPAGDPVKGDFGRVLSEKGILQSEQIGRTVGTARIKFDQVICSAAPRSQKTAEIAAPHFIMNFHTIDGDRWYNGKGRELYMPASNEDATALWEVTADMERQFNNGMIPSPMAYWGFKELDGTGSLNRFMFETRQVVSSISGIAKAKRIAIFNHAVIGNAVAEALFPQHVAVLDTIELAPCDCIRLTATTCQHIPLMT